MKGTIHPDTLQFFNELSVNNNREWFMDNKSRWEAIREQFMAFTAAVIEVMTPLDPTLGDITAKGCLYRINPPAATAAARCQATTCSWA